MQITCNLLAFNWRDRHGGFVLLPLLVYHFLLSFIFWQLNPSKDVCDLLLLCAYSGCKMVPGQISISTYPSTNLACAWSLSFIVNVKWWWHNSANDGIDMASHYQWSEGLRTEWGGSMNGNRIKQDPMPCLHLISSLPLTNSCRYHYSSRACILLQGRLFFVADCWTVE